MKHGSLFLLVGGVLCAALALGTTNESIGAEKKF